MDQAGQHLDVMQPPKRVLYRFQPLRRGPPSGRSRLAGQLEAVAQFLGGDTDGVETIGHVQHTRRIHRVAKLTGPSPHPYRQRPGPGARRRPAQLRPHGAQPTSKLGRVHPFEVRDHLTPGSRAKVVKMLSQPNRRVVRGPPITRQLVQQLDPNVYFAHPAERTPHPLQAAPGPGRRLAPDLGRDQREQFSQTPSRDATIV